MREALAAHGDAVRELRSESKLLIFSSMAATIPFVTVEGFIDALGKIELLHGALALDSERDVLPDAPRPRLRPGDELYLSPSSIQCVSPRHHRFDLLFTGYKVTDAHRRARANLGRAGQDVSLGFESVRGTQAVTLCDDVRDDADINDAYYDHCVARAADALGVAYPTNWRERRDAFVASRWPDVLKTTRWRRTAGSAPRSP